MSDMEHPKPTEEVYYRAMSEAELMEFVEQGLLGTDSQLYAELVRRVAEQDRHYDTRDSEARVRSQAHIRDFMRRVGLPIPKGV